MAFKAVICFALFVQAAYSACIGNGFNGPWIGESRCGCNNGLIGNGLGWNGIGDGLIGNGLGWNGVIGDGLIGNGLGWNGVIGDGLIGNGLGYNGVIGDGLIGNGLGWNGLGYNGLAGAGAANGLGYPSIVSSVATGAVTSTGGGLPVSSGSPIAPVGVSVLSENAYEGILSVGGNLPFLGTVGLEGVLPTGGAGAVSYGCGDGVVGIAAEGPIATGITGPGVYGPGPAALANSISAGPFGAAANYPYGPYDGVAGLGPLGFNGINGYGINNGYGIRNGCGCGNIY